MEIWKDIEGYEGIYQVSNEGRVKSFKFGKERILENGTKHNNYQFVILCEHSVKHQFHVHKLVAEAFIPNPNGYTVVHHKDHNPLNNKVDNLEWIDEDEHRRLHGIVGKNVYQYTLDGELVKIWESTRECGRNGFHQGHVASCCRGENKQHKGYRWSFKPL